MEVKSIKTVIQKAKELASQLNLTKPDDEQEPYILTADEETAAIEHEIASLKKHKAWKMAELGLGELEIMSRLEQINFHNHINRDEILRRANSNKVYAAWQENRREREAQELDAKKQEIEAFWTATNIFNLMSWESENTFGKKLIVNDDTKPLIRAICFFLSEDSRFETELGYSSEKGLIIRGVSGLGKTHLVQCVQKNELNPVLIQSMIEITDQIKSDGEFNLSMAGRKILYLDDVGTEETPVKYYGTNINWFKDFLELYYSKKKPFKNLMISTNMSFSQIEEKYGFRVRSRMKEMFNVIDVKGTDLRK